MGEGCHRSLIRSAYFCLMKNFEAGGGKRWADVGGAHGGALALIVDLLSAVVDVQRSILFPDSTFAQLINCQAGITLH